MQRLRLCTRACQRFVLGLPPRCNGADGIPSQSDDEPFQVNLSDESFETYELDPPPYSIEVTKKELKQIYHDMVVIRYD